MNFVKKIRKGFLLAVMAVASAPVCGQDLLADVAPVDSKMRAIDSLELNRLVGVEKLWDLDNPAGELYTSWDNKSVRVAGLELPSEYKIDLRQFCMPTTSRKVTSRYGYRRIRECQEMIDNRRIHTELNLFGVNHNKFQFCRMFLV